MRNAKRIVPHLRVRFPKKETFYPLMSKISEEILYALPRLAFSLPKHAQTCTTRFGNRQQAQCLQGFQGLVRTNNIGRFIAFFLGLGLAFGGL